LVKTPYFTLTVTFGRDFYSKMVFLYHEELHQGIEMRSLQPVYKKRENLI